MRAEDKRVSLWRRRPSADDVNVGGRGGRSDQNTAANMTDGITRDCSCAQLLWEKRHKKNVLSVFRVKEFVVAASFLFCCVAV